MDICEKELKIEVQRFKSKLKFIIFLLDEIVLGHTDEPILEHLEKELKDLAEYLYPAIGKYPVCCEGKGRIFELIERVRES